MGASRICERLCQTARSGTDWYGIGSPWWPKGRGFGASVFLGMFSPVWVLGMLNREYRNPEVYGRELVVNTPLPLRPECTADTRNRNRDLRELLCCVSLYEQLLLEYPGGQGARVAQSSQRTAQ